LGAWSQQEKRKIWRVSPPRKGSGRRPRTSANVASTESLNSHHMGKDDAFLLLTDTFPVKFPDIKIIPLPECKNLSCYDEIRNNILKPYSLLIGCPLAHIYDHSLYTGTITEHLKLSVIKSLQK
jgi:hypothetical protein